MIRNRQPHDLQAKLQLQLVSAAFLSFSTAAANPSLGLLQLEQHLLKLLLATLLIRKDGHEHDEYVFSPLLVYFSQLTSLLPADSGMSNSTTAMNMNTAFTTGSAPPCAPFPCTAHALERSLGQANLWFSGWTPTSSSSTAGACIGLFFLALFSRLLAVLHTAASDAWSNAHVLARESARIALPDDLPSPSLASSPSSSNPSFEKPQLVRKDPRAKHHLAQAPPFVPSIDIPRAMLFAFQSFVSYMLMLAVMTYSAWFFISIIVGLAVGELAFGRFVEHGDEGGVHM